MPKKAIISVFLLALVFMGVGCSKIGQEEQEAVSVHQNTNSSQSEYTSNTTRLVEYNIPSTTFFFSVPAKESVDVLAPRVVRVGNVSVVAADPNSDFNFFLTSDCSNRVYSSLSTNIEIRRERIGSYNDVAAVCGYSENGDGFYFRYEWCVGKQPLKVEWGLNVSQTPGETLKAEDVCRSIERDTPDFILAKSLMSSMNEKGVSSSSNQAEHAEEENIPMDNLPGGNHPLNKMSSNRVRTYALRSNTTAEYDMYIESPTCNRIIEYSIPTGISPDERWIMYMTTPPELMSGMSVIDLRTCKEKSLTNGSVKRDGVVSPGSIPENDPGTWVSDSEYSYTLDNRKVVTIDVISGEVRTK